MGFFSRLLGNQPKVPPPSGPPPNVVVAEFGAVLGTRGPAPGCVADVTELPYPKEAIKRAIVVMLTETTDSQLREHLKFAYVSLAGWQVGVGPIHQGLDVTKLDRAVSKTDLLNAVGVQGEETKKWQPIMKEEQMALIGELRQRGLW
jgi:hypothetical protein